MITLYVVAIVIGIVSTAIGIGTKQWAYMFMAISFTLQSYAVYDKHKTLELERQLHNSHHMEQYE